MSDNNIARKDLFFIPPEMIKVEDGFNVRYDYGNIEELANSIIENGVKVPLRGYKVRGKDEYILTDGHRRFKAIQHAAELGHSGIKVPFIIDGVSTNEEDRVLGMVVYNEGKRLTLLEESYVYERLINYGWSQATIAKKTGKSQTHVANCLLLGSAPVILKKRIIEGKVAASLVIEELKRKSTTEIVEGVENALAENNGKRVSSKNMTPKLKKLSEAIETLHSSTKVRQDNLKPLQLWSQYLAGNMTYEACLEKIEKL